MKMRSRNGMIYLFWWLFASTMAVAQENIPTMPPSFSLDKSPGEILEEYPLGVVDKKVAFIHHGKAIKEFTLPNGRLGWMYDVGQQEWHRTYTLVFGNDGKVIDVLYYDHSKYSKNGLTALQIQTVEPRTESPTLGSGPNSNTTD